jgi:hypothetical protein
MTASKPVEYRLADFSASEAPDSAALAQLHQTLLPDGALPRMGLGFLRHFYYTVLPREGLIFGSLAYVDGHAAGFCVNTPYPGAYMSMGIRKHPLRFAWRAGLSAVAHPGGVAASLRARKRMQATASSQTTSASRRFFEGLFLGVAPVYTHPKFIRATRILVARDLMLRTLDQCRRYGVRELRAGVMRDNVGALMLHLNTGGKIEREQALLSMSEGHLELSHAIQPAENAASLAGEGAALP